MRKVTVRWTMLGRMLL